MNVLVRIGIAAGLPAALLLGLTTPQEQAWLAPGLERQELIIAATTDVHGRVRGWDYYTGNTDTARGLARLASALDSLRRAHPGRVVLVDAGDFLQGNPLALVAAAQGLSPHPVMAAMNAMQYDAVALGNHEFDFGLPLLERLSREARFPFLAANAQRPGGQRPFPSYRIVERAGVRVAIVGATQPGAALWNQKHLQGRLAIGPIVPAVRAAAAAARAAGADVVIAVLHSGLDEASSYDTSAAGAENVAARVAREVPGLDLVVFGHTHRELAGRMVGSTMVVQPRFWAASMSVTALTLERSTAGGKWRVRSRRSRLLSAAGWPEQSEVVAAVAPGHRAALAYVGQVVGHTQSAWRSDSARVRDTPIVDLVLEVERRASGAQLASTPAFDLSARLDSGPVTVAQIARLYPYENTLVAVKIGGRQLRAYLEQSARYFLAFDRADSSAPLVNPTVPGYNFDILAGVDYVLDLERPAGQRVVRLNFQGRPVAESDTFTLALNSYRQSGAGGFAMLRGLPVVYDRQENIRELLIAEVARRGRIRPEDYFQRNWEIVPLEAVGRAWRDMAPEPPLTPSQGRALGVAQTDRVVGALHLARGRWLRVISINDFHGALEPRRDAAGVRRGGAAALAAYIARARAECQPPQCTSILLDGGDQFQGSAVSNLAYGRPVVALYTRLGVVAAALGNHEFDWGQDTLRARMAEAPYAILAANVLDRLGRNVSWIRDDTIVSLGALRVGIVGAATVLTPSVTRPSYVADLRFVDPAPIIDARARELRRRGADAVVVVAHAGAFCQPTPASGCSGEIMELARRLRERVDAIVSGHTHSAVATLVRGIPVIQARSYGSTIAVADVPLDSGLVPVVALRDVFPDSIAPDPGVDSLVRSLVEPLRPLLDRPVARIVERMSAGARGPLGNLIADAQRWAGSADLAVMNAGGVRAALDTGVATYGSLFEIQPFGNRLVKLRVRGRDLRAYLERIVARREPNAHLSGVTVVYDSTRAPGNRIVSLTLAGGRPLADDSVYSIVMNDFMVAGGDGLGLGAAALSSEELNIVDLDALISYLEAQPKPVRAPRDQRLVLRRP